MKINIYPIKSDLKHDELEKRTLSFLEEIMEGTDLELRIVNLSELYQDCSASFILVQSGGSEGKFLELFSKFKAPINILTYGSNNSLAASIEILSYLKKNGVEGEILHGSKEYIVKRIKEIATSRTIGIIGKPSDWLISSTVNVQELKKRFNIDIKFIETKELIDEYNKIEDEKVADKTLFNPKEKLKAYKLLQAFDFLVEKYELNGLTVRCFDLLNAACTTSCLALAKLNDRGIISSCEGDVPALITMMVVKEITEQVSFQANPSIIDVDDNTMILAHCTVPLSMCKSYSYDTHFESGIGLGIKGEIPEGKATIIKIGSDLNHYFLSEADILENQDDRSKCRTQIKLRLKESVTYFLTNPQGNHHIVLLGDHTKELEAYLNSKGLSRVR